MPHKILIVDDSQMILEALTDFLEEAGYEVIVAPNGREAVAVARVEDPDMIVMDIIMPEMNGVQATRELKADPVLKKIPVVAFTSTAKSEICTPEDEKMFVDYLIKPFAFDEVVDMVDKVLKTGSE